MSLQPIQIAVDRLDGSGNPQWPTLSCTIRTESLPKKLLFHVNWKQLKEEQENEDDEEKEDKEENVVACVLLTIQSLSAVWYGKPRA